MLGRRLKRKEGTNMKLQGNVLNRNSMHFAAAILIALASFVAGPNTALAASPQHHDQAPGFYRLKVGDLEDGPVRWYRCVRSALAERNESDDGWCCKGT